MRFHGTRLLAGLLSLVGCGHSLFAASAVAEVQEVASGVAIVSVSDGSSPKVGDRADFYFTVPGSDVEVSVGSGSVVSAEGGTAKVKIERSTGKVAKGHQVRFAGGTSPPQSSPAPSESPAPVAESTSPPSEPVPVISPEEAQSSPTFSPTRTVPATEGSSGGASQPVDAAAQQSLQDGIAQYTAGNYDAAIVSYTNAIRDAPDFAVAYLNRANAHLFKRHYREAIADADKALQLKVEKADDAYNIRGSARAGQNDFDSAIADCNRALKINPRNALAYNNRANNKLRKRDYSGALSDCNKSIALDSNSGLPYYNRGYANYDLGNYGAAASDWKQAVEMQPSYAAELNPKIAQLESSGSTGQSRRSGGNSAGSQWTDLTNAPQKLVGAWKGGRHMTQYLADGSFYTDPHLVPNPPRGEWRIEGDRLIQFFPNANITLTQQILSIDDKTLVLQNAQGKTFRLSRVSQ